MAGWMTRTGTLAWAAAGVAALSLGAMALAPRLLGESSCGAGAVMGGAVGGPFTLVNGEGVEVTEAEVIDRPALLYFGYASCPDICPFDMARNGEAAALLAERGVELRPVFVTIDPARDTPEVAGDYAANFGDDAVGLSGSEEQVAAAAAAYRVYYAKGAGAGDDYLMDHSTFSYVMLPGEGGPRFADIVRREESAQEVADRVACLVEA